MIIKPYDIYDDIAEIRNEKVLLKLMKTNLVLMKLWRKAVTEAFRLLKPKNAAVLMKAVKNSSEIKNLKEVILSDGAAVLFTSAFLKRL